MPNSSCSLTCFRVFSSITYFTYRNGLSRSFTPSYALPPYAFKWLPAAELSVRSLTPLTTDRSGSISMLPELAVAYEFVLLRLNRLYG